MKPIAAACWTMFAISIATASSLNILNNQFLTLEGTLTNQGTVALSSVGNDTRLISAGSVTLVGGGVVQLSDNTSNSLMSNGAPAVLINRDNLITGAGQIGNGDRNLAMTNETAGVIDASGDNALQINFNGGTLVNNGTIEATSTISGNGGLTIVSSTIDNSGSNNAGATLSSGTTGHVNLRSSTILGGTLVAIQGGDFEEDDRGSTFDNVTIGTGGDFHITNNNFLTVAGSLTNLGTVYLNWSATDAVHLQRLRHADRRGRRSIVG